jgi:hypothetical protein
MQIVAMDIRNRDIESKISPHNGGQKDLGIRYIATYLKA